MRKTILQALVATIVTFIITFFTNFIIEYNTKMNGEIVIGPNIKVNKQNYFLINIENYSKETITNLKFTIPEKIKKETIISNEPLLIEFQENETSSNEKKYLIVNEIMAQKKIQILIPITHDDDVKKIEFLNHYEKKLTITLYSKLTDIKKDIINNGIFYAFLYSILAFIGSFFSFRKMDIILNKINLDKQERSKLYEKIQNFQEEINKEKENFLKLQIESKESILEYHNTTIKNRLILLSRISDYNKELDFWKDTIRKLLVKNDKINPEGLFTLIRDNLKTYGTAKKIEELDNIYFLKKIYLDDKVKD